MFFVVQYVGFEGCGWLVEGYVVDFVFFDLYQIFDVVMLFDFGWLFFGIRGVWVNGQRVFEDGEMIDVCLGQVLCR